MFIEFLDFSYSLSLTAFVWLSSEKISEAGFVDAGCRFLFLRLKTSNSLLVTLVFVERLDVSSEPCCWDSGLDFFLTVLIGEFSTEGGIEGGAFLLLDSVLSPVRSIVCRSYGVDVSSVKSMELFVLFPGLIVAARLYSVSF